MNTAIFSHRSILAKIAIIAGLLLGLTLVGIHMQPSLAAPYATITVIP